MDTAAGGQATGARRARGRARWLACLLAAVLAVALAGCVPFARERIADLPGEPAAIATADVDGDGAVDALVGHVVPRYAGVTVLGQDRFGFWERREPDSFAVASELLAVVELDGDGQPDLVAGGANALQPLLNTGGGRFLASGVAVPGRGTAGLTALAAANAPGGAPLAVVAYAEGGAQRLATYASGGGGLGLVQDFARTGADVRRLALHDVTGDGRLDVVAGTAAGAVEVYRGTATHGRFETSPAATLTAPGHGAAVTALAVGDVATPDLPTIAARGWRADGIPDVLAAFDDGDAVAGWRGSGGGAFAAGQDVIERAPTDARVVALMIAADGSGAWSGLIRRRPGTAAHPHLWIFDRVEYGMVGIEAACDALAGAPVPYETREDRFAGVAIVCGDGSVVVATPQAARMHVDPTAIDFGGQRAGTASDPRVVELRFPDDPFRPRTYARIVGPDAGDFVVRYEPDMCGIPGAPAWACRPWVTFAPRSRGAKAATLQIPGAFVAAGRAPHAVALRGVAIGPVAAATPTARDLGAVPVGEQATATVTVRNDGDLSLQVTGARIEGDVDGWSAQLGSCATPVAPTGTCALTVRFAPRAAGAARATLEIDSDSVEAAPTVALAAEAVAPAIAVAPVAFGAVPVGARVERTATIANAGRAPLTVADLALVGPDADAFALDGADGCTAGALAPGASCAVTVAAAPPRPGPLAAALRVDGDAPDGPATVDVTATGVQGALAAPATVDAGAIAVGAAAEVAVPLANAGDAPLTIAAVTPSGPVALAADGCTGRTLAAGAGCALTVRVAPPQVGPVAGELAVAHDGDGAPTRIAVAATGTLPSPEPLPPPAPLPPPDGGGPAGPPDGGDGAAPPAADRGGRRLAVRAPAAVALRRGRGVLPVVVRNAGDRVARGLVLRIRLPRGVRLATAPARRVRARAGRGGVATVRLGALAPRRARTLRLRLRADAPARRRALPAAVTLAGRDVPPARARVVLRIG